MTLTDPENDLTDANIVTKYKTAAGIAQKAMDAVIAAALPNTKILDLCKLGDAFILKETKGVYNKGKVAKGIAFPTCISNNAIICHMSPLESDPEATWCLKKGDQVRIELGVHVDGYIAQVAHTIMIGSEFTAVI